MTNRVPNAGGEERIEVTDRPRHVISCGMTKPHTHLEFWHADGTILQASDENAAPFPIKIGEQIILGNKPYEVSEIIDGEPRESNGTLYYRRVVRVK